ncbi:MAG: transglycosylase domain-containing protein [Pseudomonadota bacterium]|nr:transglycosylase domain-containing protein [Pseudomonadota bacterium]
MTKKRRRRLWSRLIRFIFTTVLIGFVGISAYVVYLDATITRTFEGRRWTVPAQVFAQPLEVYEGMALSQEAFVFELDRLGYSENASGKSPGTYYIGPKTVVVTLRPFQFPDGHRTAQTLSVRFRDGQLSRLLSAGQTVSVRLEPAVIGSFFPSHGEDRLIIEPEKTPQLLTETLIAVEDRNFRSHWGFDLGGILRALMVNIAEGKVRQGGSTLTQQLVKSYFLDNRRTFTRKFRELVMAIILERHFEKDELLNAYINEIFLGQNGRRAIHGFGLGSQFYFRRPLEELDAEEIALMVAIVRGPTYYNPYRYPERAKARRDRVLSTMHAYGLVDDAVFRAALAKPIQLATSRGGGRYYPAFMDLVRRELSRDFDSGDLAINGYRIFTTLKPHLQDAAQTASLRTLGHLERERKLPSKTLEAAVIIRDSQTGDIHAVVGGRTRGSQGFNRALDARRQVGSLLKPVVALTALESGRYHLASSVDDTPIVLPDFRNWAPLNFDGQFRGPVPLIRALSDSLNVATVRVGIDVGVANVANRITSLTGKVISHPFPSLFLGALDLTPFEVSELYAAFASGGFRTPGRSVVVVLDDEADTLSRYSINVKQMFSSDNAASMTRALQVTMQRGTGRSSQFQSRGIAGKTGSSDNYRDSWVAVFDANLLTVVWIGQDNNRPHGLSGSRGALRLWDLLAQDLAVQVALVPTLSNAMQWTWINYQTGSETLEQCQDAVNVPLPNDVELPRESTCEQGSYRRRSKLGRWLD